MILDALRVRDEWAASGAQVVAATVVRTWGSSPWPAGTRFLVSSDGETHGSVSGGCVEEDLRLRALRVLETGAEEMVSYGVSDDDAFGVGLACGGTIELHVAPW
jgi:xanthine/CO dehydrogenase XdhC/CoxF family maturation factor